MARKSGTQHHCPRDGNNCRDPINTLLGQSTYCPTHQVCCKQCFDKGTDSHHLKTERCGSCVKTELIEASIKRQAEQAKKDQERKEKAAREAEKKKKDDEKTRKEQAKRNAKK